MLPLKGPVIPYPQPWVHMVMPSQTLALLNTKQDTETDWGTLERMTLVFLCLPTVYILYSLISI